MSVDQAARELALAAGKYVFAAIATVEPCDWLGILERLRDVENVIATGIAHAEHAAIESRGRASGRRSTPC